MGEHINIYLLILLGMLMYLVLQDPLGNYLKDYCTVDINVPEIQCLFIIIQGFYLYVHLVQVVQEVLGDQMHFEPHHTQRLYR